MKQGLSVLILALFATTVNATSLTDTVLKGIAGGSSNSAGSNPAPKMGGSYYGGKDVAGIVVAKAGR